MIRGIVYWLCFGLVAISSAYLLVVLMTRPFPEIHLRVLMPPRSIEGIFIFGSPVPWIFARNLPEVIRMSVNYAMLFLVLRRAWLLIGKSERTPAAFRGLQQILGYIGIFSLALAAMGILLAIALHAGSGVPIGYLVMPAIFCIPWAFLLTELFSFQRKSVNPSV